MLLRIPSQDPSVRGLSVAHCNLAELSSEYLPVVATRVHWAGLAGPESGLALTAQWHRESGGPHHLGDRPVIQEGNGP